VCVLLAYFNFLSWCLSDASESLCVERGYQAFFSPISRKFHRLHTYNKIMQRSPLWKTAIKCEDAKFNFIV